MRHLKLAFKISTFKRKMQQKFKPGDRVKVTKTGLIMRVKQYKSNPITMDRDFRPFIVVCESNLGFGYDTVEMEVFEETLEKVD